MNINLNRSGSAFRIATLVLITSTVAACSSSSDDGAAMVGCAMLDTGESTGAKMVVATRAGDYTSGQTETIALDGCAVSDGAYEATGSDIRVSSNGSDVYQLGRSSLDNITKYNIAGSNDPLYQYSVADANAMEGEGANPYQLIFVSDTKAYLIRYDSAKMWIVNPSAQSEEEYKLGELDLSAYDSLDITPEANGAVLVGTRLYILMERQERRSQFDWVVERTGYVAVFDTDTDEEVDTGKGAADNLKGIPLAVTNPNNIQYSAADEMIYLIGRGNNFGTEEEGVNRYTGGIESIDPTSFDTALVYDDGTEETNNGFVVDLVVVSATQAFVTTTNGWQSNSVYSFNMLTNTLGESALSGSIADGSSVAFSDMDITTLVAAPGDSLMVGIGGDNPGFSVLNATDGSSMAAFVPTLLVPINAVFAGL